MPGIRELLAHNAKSRLSRAEALVGRGVDVTRAMREERDLPDYVAVGAGWGVIESGVSADPHLSQTVYRDALFSAFARRLGESEDRVSELQSRYEDVRTRLRELTGRSGALLG